MEPGARDYLAVEDEALLRQCGLEVYRSSGPGGQHRNKVSSAVRLTHKPTGVQGHGDESRSQLENRRMALRRLRMNLACRVRGTLDPAAEPPQVVRGCMFVKRGPEAARRLEVGVRDYRFWTVAAWMLDALAAAGGAVSEVGKRLGISTGNVADFFLSERHLLTAANGIRKERGLRPLE